MAIKKLLIANRGEIAVRIHRAAHALGIKTVQVMSKADHEMLAVRMADEAVEIGPAQATKSYLNAPAILHAAKHAGADAIHPGYGFLSENAGFAAAVAEAGLIFVGPDAATIRLMGDKAAARDAAAKAGVPTVPGSHGRVHEADAVSEARRIGFPVMVKAAAGGGGRGIRVAHTEAELEQVIHHASAEAHAAFGDGGLYLETLRRQRPPRRGADPGRRTRRDPLFERECSLQRRRQKVWEEAPAACLDEATRQKLCASAAAWPGRSATEAPGRWNTFTTRPPANSSSSR